MKLFPALLLCLTLCACGPDEAAPSKPKPKGTWVEIDADQPIELTAHPQAPGHAVVTPPRGRWLLTQEQPRAAEFYIRYEDVDTVVMQAQVFETKGSREPVTVLKQAIDSLHRLRGIDGIGWGGGKALDVWGRPAAERAFHSVVNGVKRTGLGRLLLMTDHLWAFSWCELLTDADAKTRDAAFGFVRSLEPKEPSFYAPTFRMGELLDRKMTSVVGEESVLGLHVAAVQLCMEASVGVRTPLHRRKRVFDAIAAGLAKDTPETRQGFRESGERVVEWMDLGVDERLPNLEGLGRQVLQGLIKRAEKGDIAAMQVLMGQNEAGAFPIGDKPDGLSQFHVDNWIDMCAFLVSIARDAPVTITAEQRERLTAALEERWETSLDREKVELHDTDRQWAALRRAWDLAAGPVAKRAHFRRQVAELLAPEPAKVDVRSLTSLRDLMTWMRALNTQEPVDKLLDRAAALPAADRAALFDVLEVSADGYQLGW